MAFEYKNNPLPANTYKITSHFGYRSAVTTSTGKSSSNHKGIDLGAAGGTPIYAVADGTVETVKYDWDGYGNYIRINHGDGVKTLYAHMMKASTLPEGTTVKAGDIIGYVGTTGSSTGNHLHFEMIFNGSHVNPLKFIESGHAVVASPEDYQQYAGDDISNNSNSIALSSKTGINVGQRVATLSPQPLHAYVNIRTGNNQEILSTSPSRSSIIQSFEYQKLQDSGENVIFTIFDDNWEEIEEKLAANWDNITFEYGYYGTGVRSKIIRMRLLTYNISFETTGTIISVEAITEGAVVNLNPVNEELATYNPTEAVKKICKKLGFIVEDQNFDPSKDIADPNSGVDPFNLTNDYPISYIMNVIIPQASEENEELFTFRVDSNNIAYFKREDPVNINPENIRTYIYQKGYDSPVISFDVQLEGVFGGANGGSDVFTVMTKGISSVFESTTKEESSVSQDKSSVVTAATGDISHTRPDQSSAQIDASGYSASQMNRRLYYHLKENRFDAYKATLTIVGDPTIELFDYIRVINVTDAGYLHHTSGIYFIEGVIDTVNVDGTMTTTLKLMRNATKSSLITPDSTIPDDSNTEETSTNKTSGGKPALLHTKYEIN